MKTKMYGKAKLEGCWILLDKKGNKTCLYTLRAFDHYIDKRTNEVYTRGDWIICREGIPPLIDKDPNFEFKMDGGEGLSASEILNEILFKK